MFLFLFLLPLAARIASTQPESTQIAAAFPYPPYCFKSAEHHPEYRRSPPLDGTFLQLQPELIQVQAFIRHGSRTPYAAHGKNCWPSHKPVWVADYDVGVSGTSLSGVHDPHMKVFRVAQVDGNEVQGQLVSEGARQHQLIGEELASNYLIPSSPFKLPTPNTSPLLRTVSEGDIHLRTTDTQRTILSAIALSSSFLGSINKTFESPLLHTTPYSTDYWVENFATPNVRSIWEKLVKEDKIYEPVAQKYATMLDVLRRDLNTTIDFESDEFPYALVDCWYTTICTPSHWNDLPPALSPVLISGHLAEVDEMINGFYSVLRTGAGLAYSRASMGRAVRDIRDAMIHASSVDAPKFVLYSAHDTSLMPLLASLGGGVWDRKLTPYASLGVVEVYKIPDPHNNDTYNLRFSPLQNAHFRLIFNGSDRTLLFPNCSASPCPVETFLAETNWALEGGLSAA